MNLLSDKLLAAVKRAGEAQLKLENETIDADAVVANIALLQAVVDHLHPDARPPWNPNDLTTVAECTEKRIELTNYHAGTARIRANAWNAWIVSRIPVEAPEVTNLDKADALLRARIAVSPACIPLKERVARNHASFNALQQAEDMAKLRAIPRPTLLNSRGILTVYNFLDEVKKYHDAGGMATLMELIDPDTQISIQATIPFPIFARSAFK